MARFREPRQRGESILETSPEYSGRVRERNVIVDGGSEQYRSIGSFLFRRKYILSGLLTKEKTTFICYKDKIYIFKIIKEE